MFIDTNIPQCRRYDIEQYECKSGRIENIISEITIDKKKWLVHSVYKFAEI